MAFTSLANKYIEMDFFFQHTLIDEHLWHVDAADLLYKTIHMGTQ